MQEEHARAKAAASAPRQPEVSGPSKEEIEEQKRREQAAREKEIREQQVL